MENHLRTRDHDFIAFASHLLDQDRDLHFAARIDLKRPRSFRVVDLERNVAARFANKALANITRSHKFSFAPGKRRIVYQNLHANRRRIDIHKLKRRPFFAICQGVADINFLETGQSNDVAGGRVFYFHLLQSRVGKERRDCSPLMAAIAVDADDRVANYYATTDDAPERNSSEVITVIQIRDEHLKEWLARNFWRRHMLHDRLKERRHVFVVFVQFAHGKTVLRARVDDWKIELLVGRFQFDEEIENLVQDFVRARVFSVDLVDDNNRLQFVLQRLAQDKTRLRLWPIVRIDNEQHAVHHFHDSFDFAAEIGVTGRIDDVDPIAVPFESCVLCADRDPFFTLEIHRIHHALFNLLIGAKRARLAQQLIDQRCLAVIDVRYNGNITNLIHSIEGTLSRAGGRRILRRKPVESTPGAARSFP